MGCDIHMYVEYKNTKKERRDWLCGDYFHTNDPMSDDTKLTRVELYGERDYSLFAVLANVRNYDYIKYMAEPRGLPIDATDFVNSEYLKWGCDAHSCSYFTLQELIDFHNENEPRDTFGDYILKPLIDRLKQRADELNLIWAFEWTSATKRDPAYKKADNIRIVFWFDN